jgi:2-polyprenyl-3-methyl-5-hydroxy-6-metoxy-1,4-benzoquinol methylase
MKNVISPVTGSANTTLTDIFLSSDIIMLYRVQLGMDVTRFFPGRENFSLYRCNATGYRFYYPDGMDGDGEFYGILQQKLGDGYYHDWKFEYQLAYDVLHPNDKVLDIGCGTGKFLARAKDKAREVVGLELNEKAVTVCRQNNLTVHHESLGDHVRQRPGYYDVVCTFQVLEHVYEVKAFIKDALLALKPGGLLVIGVPNSEPYFLGYDKYCTLNLPPHHMGLWNKKVFEKLAPLFGLKLEKVVYDVKGSIRTEAYLRAKYIAGIRSPGGFHSISEKVILVLLGIITVPLAILKKMTNGIPGSHIAVLMTKG